MSSAATVKVMGTPSLLERAAPVTHFDEALEALIQTLHATMIKEGGAGIAAPQIGVSQRIILFGFEHNARYPDMSPVPFTVLINPEYEPLSAQRTSDWEGCLSVPGLRGLVPRYESIRYWGVDAHNQPIERHATGFHARIIQHEVDHLDGILYPMRIEDLRQFGFETALIKQPTRSTV